MKKALLYLFIVLFIAPVYAQQYEECGTVRTAEEELTINSFVASYRSGLLNVQRDLGDSLVPVKFHIISTDAGTGGIDSAFVFDELDSINTHYKAAGIVFYHCDNIDYIYSSNYSNFEKIVDETLCDSLDLANVINIYFVPGLYKIDGNGSTINLCGYAYSSGTKNRILMKNSCSTNGSTLAHELGHYFSLPHTHSTSTGDELVDGSNCSFAGDLFCDTPADPVLSTSVVNSSCDYTGSDTDANGDLYAPNTRNVMSYSRKSCRNQFSAEQLAQMGAYLVSYRYYLHCPSTVLPNSIEESNNKGVRFSVSPNPSSGQFVINYILSKSSELVTITLTDEIGRIVFSKVITTSIPVDQYNFDDLALKNGIYFLELRTKDNSHTKKV
ncbi:MAG: zinc-dependent metalloprotease, partial [Flavobacteriales bacterium]|nr:zinc-dependent metalloprotease [Flavobacteriales bacterium]